MLRRHSIASVTFALALAFTLYEASSPAASKEAPKPAQTFSTLGIKWAAPTVPAVRAAAKTPALRIAQTPSPGVQAPLKKFRVLLPFKVGITFFPISVANELGYLKDEGIDLDLQVANGSSAVVQQVAAGNAEIGVILAPNTLLGFSEGVNYKAFYDFLTKNSFDVKVVGGAPISRPADLKGKKIGTIDLTRGDLPLLRAELQRAGLNPQRDVQLVALGFNMALHAQALKDGRVDALNISWNNSVGVEAAGVKLKCITCEEEFQLASETTVVPDGIFQQDRRYIIGFGRAMAKATLFAETNPDAAIAIMKKVAPQEQTDPAFTKTFFAAALDIMKPRQPGKYGLQDIGGWERLQDFMAAPVEGQPTGLQTKVDVKRLVTNELVEEFNKFDVEAVRKQAMEYRP
jgi:NitT/TauT family transport system substrate-binding protein